MYSYNRGEWSEFYGVLFLLVKPKMQIVDSNLNLIKSDLFLIKKIILDSKIKLEYILDKCGNILIYADSKSYNSFSKETIDKERQKLLKEIQNHTEKTGAFSIPSEEEFISSMTKGVSFKSKSDNKSDLATIVLDIPQSRDVELTYSIKSSLGSPATILNASSNTNFKYKVVNFPISLINQVNSINTSTKLLDRINKILSYPGTNIVFDSVPSTTFEYNLKMIDTNLPEYLANALLYSYTKNNKDLKTIFRASNPTLPAEMADKKLGDFLNGISFGFVPGSKWDGNNSVNGGLIIVKENGDVVVLDLVYYKHFVNDFIVNESKLDSPSASRYHMLELFVENGNVYFTLNLQVRYKK